LDNDGAVLRRRGSDQHFHGIDAARTGLHPNGAPPAKKRNGVRFFDEARWFFRECRFVEPRQRERVARIVHSLRNDPLDALSYESRIRSVDQGDRLLRTWLGEIALDISGFESGHATSACYVPATKYDARRLRIFSAIVCAARFSASRNPRWRAKRCVWPG